VATRHDDGHNRAEDLANATIATHLPRATTKWFAEHGVPVNVVAMGGALEGVCAAGLADAIVDLRETGSSLAENGLTVLAHIAECEALFVHNGADPITDLVLRLTAVLTAQSHRYVMLHLPPERVIDLTSVFTGLAAPTVIPLAQRDDLVAVHLVVDAATFWNHLPELRAIQATGIVALPPDALLP